MNFINYLYEQLKVVNEQRKECTTHSQRMIWLNGQREKILQMIKDLEDGNNTN
jgi:hypothetical protein